MSKIFFRYWGLMILGIIGYAGYIFFFGEYQQVFEEFSRRYYIFEVLTGFLKYMLVFHMVVSVIYWCWHRVRSATATHTVSHVFLVTLPSILLYIIAISWLYPQLELTKQRYFYTSRYLELLVKQAETAIEEGRPEFAVRLLEKYTSLTTRDEPVETLLLKTRAQLGSRPAREDNTDSLGLAIELRESNASELYARAEEYFDEDDYVSSFYFAGAAALLSEPPREDAILLQEETRLLIEEGELVGQETSARELFFRKSAAVQALIAGRMDPDEALRAYKMLRVLRDAFPEDIEITQWYAESFEGVKKRSFFLVDAIVNENRPGFYNVWFLDTFEDRYLVFFAKHMSYETGISYAFDVEIIEIERESFRTSGHIQVEVVQIIDNVVHMRGLTADGVQQEIQILDGSLSDDVYVFRRNIADVVSRNRIQQNWNTVGMLDFFRILRESSERIQFFMISYLVIQGAVVLLFFVFSFWIYVIVDKYIYIRREKDEWYAWLVVPLIFFVILFCYEWIMYVITTLSMALHRMIGLTGAIAGVGGLLLAALVVGVIQTQREPNAGT